MKRKFINFWHPEIGIPVERGEPNGDCMVLRAVTPDECVGTVILSGDRESHTVYEVLAVGPKVTRYVPGDIVLPVFEALRVSGSHLVCREEEITVRWDPEQLYAEVQSDAA